MIAICLAIGMTACILSFQLALDRHFVRAGRMPRAAMVLAILSTAVYLSALFRLWMAGAPSMASSAAAAALMLGSFLLFHGARRGSPPRLLPVAFEEDASPQRVVAEGAHRFVRHPFYVAYMLYWVAVVLSAPYVVTIAGAASIIVMYVVTAAGEEQRLLNSPLGAEYRKYQGRTGRFFPRPTALWNALR